MNKSVSQETVSSLGCKKEKKLQDQEQVAYVALLIIVPDVDLEQGYTYKRERQ